jgi:hypothetical protein
MAVRYIQVPGEPVFDVERRRYVEDAVVSQSVTIR